MEIFEEKILDYLKKHPNSDLKRIISGLKISETDSNHLSNYLKNYGRAFGINTVALFLGSLLYFAGVDGFNIAILPLIVFISALVFLFFCK